MWKNSCTTTNVGKELVSSCRSYWVQVKSHNYYLQSMNEDLTPTTIQLILFLFFSTCTSTEFLSTLHKSNILVGLTQIYCFYKGKELSSGSFVIYMISTPRLSRNSKTLISTLTFSSRTKTGYQWLPTTRIQAEASLKNKNSKQKTRPPV